MANTTDQGQLVLLELLSWAPAVAESAARHLGLDLLDGDLQPGRQTFDHGDEGLAVGLAGGQEAEHPGEATPAPDRNEQPVRPPQLVA